MTKRVAMHLNQLSVNYTLKLAHNQKKAINTPQPHECGSQNSRIHARYLLTSHLSGCVEHGLRPWEKGKESVHRFLQIASVGTDLARSDA